MQAHLPCLHSLDALCVLPASDRGPPILQVGAHRLRIPSWRYWYDGLRWFDGEQWQPASVLAWPVIPEAPADITVTASDAVEAWVCIRVGRSDFHPGELGYWSFELPADDGWVEGDASDFEFPEPPQGEPLPQLLPGWKACGPAEKHPWGRRWRVQHVDSWERQRWIDELILPNALAERCADDLYMLRDRAAGVGRCVSGMAHGGRADGDALAWRRQPANRLAARRADLGRPAQRLV